MTDSSNATTLIYVGTYTTLANAPVKALGIYAYKFDPSTGALTLAHKMPKVSNPSYLTLHPSGRYLYAVNEIQTMDRKPGGGVSAFAIDPETGALRYLNRQPSHGVDPCHVCVDRTGRFAMVANYSSGSVAIYPIDGDGTLGEASDVVQHVGSSVDPERQTGPHAHSIKVDPTNRFALVADLGLDRIGVYRLDLENGKLVPNDPPGASAAPGSGPRHLDFHPNGRYVYVVNEMASSITAFAYDDSAGMLKELHTLSTLPESFSGENDCADIHVGPSGQFVYASNRGHDSITIFSIDRNNGTLTPVGRESTRGNTPRNFAIDPSGTVLLAANQDSCSLVAFRIDPETGQLTPLGDPTEVPTPVCVKFAAAID